MWIQIENDAESNTNTIETARNTTSPGAVATSDGLFVDNDSRLYVAIGNEITEENQFRMYLPKWRGTNNKRRVKIKFAWDYIW